MATPPLTLSRRQLLAAAPAFGAVAWGGTAAAQTPAPYGALPSERLVRWHEMEVYAFLHFTINTFTDREWGMGDEDPSLFNPTAFDPDAIVAALKDGGMTGVILTCKHHDGFCLWPTKTTEHCVRNTRWRNGKGDVVKEIAEAAARQGLKFGVYLSPWDRNSAFYGHPRYVDLYQAQLKELLTWYGPIFEVWHDGANGGDGYYGGAREKRLIDKRTYYQWPKTWELVRSLQPDAVVFSDIGPDLRWVGNEKGIANETCWATYDPVGEDGGPAAVGDTRYKEAGTGHRNGSKWLPAECDVSIRPGWFWHEAENKGVKTAEQILDLYFKSTGRGGSLLLNIPPDRRGLLCETDVESLRGFGRLLKSTFRENLAVKARTSASNVRGKQGAYGVRNLFDGNRSTYWSTDNTVLTPEVELRFSHPVTFSVVRLRENIRLGQRIDAVEVEAWQHGAWQGVAGATSIGSCRLIRTSSSVTADRVRLRIKQASACPALSEFGLFA